MIASLTKLSMKLRLQPGLLRLIMLNAYTIALSAIYNFVQQLYILLMLTSIL
jgi:hypothetical protein